MTTLLQAIKLAGGVVVAYGGGVDSTAMILELVRLGIRIDAILFADTGDELPRTYKFLELFSRWLVAHGYPAITIVRNVATRDSAKGAKAGVFESLSNQLMRLGNLPPVAFNVHSCAEKMKIRPQDKWLEAQPWVQAAWAEGKKILKLVGFDAEEGYRANRKAFQKVMSGDKYALAFPLMEWGWNREKCDAVIAAAGLPNPGKSACYHCPMRKVHEIQSLSEEYPELFDRALALEARALSSGKLKQKEIKGLGGRKFAWRDLKIERKYAV